MPQTPLILVLIAFVTMLSCQPKPNTNFPTQGDTIASGIPGHPPAPCEEYGSALNILSNGDTLKIAIEFSDCGEWGGHKEVLQLHKNGTNQIIAEIDIDSVDCTKIFYGQVDDRFRKTILNKTAVVDKDSERVISEFIQGLVKLNLKHQIDSNAGAIYHVSLTAPASLDFVYWNSGDCRDTHYKTLRSQLFGI